MSIEICDVKFSYGNHKVLNGVTFKANLGDSIYVLGRNGAGKTTMFRCILGLLKGYEGDIFVDGKNIKKMPAKQLARSIAYIPQSHEPAFNYSVLDIVLMGKASYVPTLNSPKREDIEDVINILKKLSLLHIANRGYAQISGGERQLVLVARALAQKSKIIVMDEPTANLDYTNQILMMKRINKLSDKGYIILISTHNPEHALINATRVLVLKEGNIYKIGKPKEIITKELIFDIYDVDADVIEYKNGGKDKITLVPNY